MDYPLRRVDQLREHLRALRRLRGLTQSQLGQRLGLSQVRIAEIEADPAVVSAEQIVRILSVLGATLVLRDTASEASHAPETAPASAAPVRKLSRRTGAAASTPNPDPDAPTSPAAPVLKRKKGTW